jgi:hypothetical protein
MPPSCWAVTQRTRVRRHRRHASGAHPMTIHPSREPQAEHQGPASTVSPSGSCTPSPFVGSAVAARSARSALTGTFQRPNTFTARSSSASWRFSRFSSVPCARPRMRAASRKGTCNSGRLTQMSQRRSAGRSMGGRQPDPGDKRTAQGPFRPSRALSRTSQEANTGRPRALPTAFTVSSPAGSSASLLEPR